MKELRETAIPDREKEIGEIRGATVVYEIDWDSMADDLEALRFLDNVSCFRLAMALRSICTDDLGKEAVREGLKTVKPRNVKSMGERRIHFEKGVLEMDCMYSEKLSGAYSDRDIEQVPTKGL